MSGASDLANLRDAVVGVFKAGVPGVPSIAAHGGAFTKADVAAFMTQTPSIRIAIMGVEVAKRSNLGIVLPVNFSAVIVTRDTVDPASGAKLSRDTQGLLIANAVSLLVMSNRFGLEAVYQPENLRSVNQYSEEFFASGLALWEVTWTSPVTLGFNASEAIAALAQIYINGVLFADPQPVDGADPLVDPATLPPPSGAPWP